ncbi:MAG TPA: copper resistance protein NlpE N-terminal domain-containing protein [Ginsengibacter sp.]|nr:copper resistance protein NlpE N-terminal domain-containing protein [Ginsengibacter sp.]
MKFVPAIILFAIISFCCNETPPAKQPVIIKDTTEIQDTIIVKDSVLSSAIADSLPLGAYQGIFPCKDCDGIQQTILFNSDKTFREEQMIWSKNEAPKISEGNWQRKNNKIELTQNNKPVIDFDKRDDTLFAVNINGVVVNDSSKYSLTKRNLADNNPVWNKKRSAGIDFVAMGNEPFWNLEVDYEKSILFKLADWKKPLIVRIEKSEIDKDSTVYKLKSDTTKWRITILPQFCNDGMSDFLYQYKVIIKYNGILYKGCGLMLSKKISQ